MYIFAFIFSLKKSHLDFYHDKLVKWTLKWNKRGKKESMKLCSISKLMECTSVYFLKFEIFW